MESKINVCFSWRVYYYRTHNWELASCKDCLDKEVYLALLGGGEKAILNYIKSNVYNFAGYENEDEWTKDLIYNSVHIDDDIKDATMRVC